MRIVMKISGEALKNDLQVISSERLDMVLDSVIELKNNGNQVILVTGGGNFWRGRNDLELLGSSSDYIGMLSTISNAIAVSSYLNKNNIKSKLYSSIYVEGIAEKYKEDKVFEDLENGNVVVLGGGLGVPNFSTDMVTILKANELKADLIIMAKNIDGVYDKDPRKHNDARKYNKLSFEKFFNLQLQSINSSIIDFEANAALYKYKISTYFYDIKDNNGIKKYLSNNFDGTYIGDENEK